MHIGKAIILQIEEDYELWVQWYAQQRQDALSQMLENRKRRIRERMIELRDRPIKKDDKEKERHSPYSRNCLFSE